MPEQNHKDTPKTTEANPTLDYLHPRTRSARRSRPSTFWLAHSASALIGVFVLRPLILGRRVSGDPSLFSVVAASAIVIAALLYMIYRAYLRDSDPVVGYSIAVAVGLAAFVPADAVHGLLLRP